MLCIHPLGMWGRVNAVYRGNGVQTWHLWGVQLLFMSREGRNLTTNWTYRHRQIGCRCIFHESIGSDSYLHVYVRWKLPGGEERGQVSCLPGTHGTSWWNGLEARGASNSRHEIDTIRPMHANSRTLPCRYLPLAYIL